MLNKKEAGIILLITLVLALSVSFLKSLNLFLESLASIFLVLVLNVGSKKVTAYYLESEIEIRPWQIQRFGFKPKQELKNPFPMGVFLPLILSAITFGNFYWMASLIFEIKPKISRAAKHHGLYSYSEITERHIGLIAAAGIFVNLLFAVVGYFAGFPFFAKLNIYFAFFNMLPISDLDGNKIFFGNLVLWSFLATLVLIGLGYAFFLT